MTVIPVPGHLPAFKQMASTPARALTFATDLRAVTVGVKDVQGWAEGISAPEWEGDTHEAHAHATTRFAARLDTVEAALDRAVTAADRFEARLTVLTSLRGRINKERLSVNDDADALRAEVEAAGEATPEQLEAFRRRGEGLVTRATEVAAEIDDWVTRHDAAETDFIASLARVDSVAEGEIAAEDVGRVDVDALTGGFMARKDDPARLGAWWARLSAAERQALITEHPRLVGNAAGLPSEARDEANRAAVESDIDYLEQREGDGQLSRAEKRVLENAHHVRDALENHRDDRDLATGRELAHLLVYKPGEHGGDGAVAISFGDPDTADHVSVNVPGLTSEASSTVGNVDKTWALHQAAVAEGNGTVASVYWLDYDAPSGNPLNPLDPLGQLDFGSVALTDKADVGGERFSDFIDGLRASDRGDPAHLTAIGHSYGSTTVGHALQDGLDVDDAVLIGSPGVPEDTAAALTDAEVWIGSKDYDPVSLLGRGERGGVGALGHDPAEDDFGGTRFATGDGSLRVQDLLDNHTSYFEGESLENLANVVTDHDEQVSEQPHRGEDGGGYLTLSELLAASSGASAGELILDTGRDVGAWLLENSRLGGIL